MTHEPGQGRYMTFRCEHCGRIAQEGELTLIEILDEYWCEACVEIAEKEAHAHANSK